jgi:acetyltransferase-like isoleucine patch superfamily enzyme
MIVNSYIQNIETFKYGHNVEIGCYNRIGDNVKIGNNVVIGHHCIIDENVTIGDNVTIENYVLLKKFTVVGNDTFIDSYVRSSGYNQIGSNVTIRYGATIAKEVTICDGSFISPNVMTIYSSHEGKGIPGTIIGENAFIGTAAVIGPGVTIVKDVVIGAMAYVSKNCDEKGIYVGVPAKMKK